MLHVQVQTVNVLHVTQDTKNQEQAVLHVQIQNTVLKVIQELKHVLPNGADVLNVIHQIVQHVQADIMQTEQAAAHVQVFQQDVQPALIQQHVQLVHQVITKILQINA